MKQKAFEKYVIRYVYSKSGSAYFPGYDTRTVNSKLSEKSAKCCNFVTGLFSLSEYHILESDTRKVSTFQVSYP